MLEPLVPKSELRRRFDATTTSREAWRSLAEEPLGASIERYLKDDLVRGLVLTDAKIGIFTHPHDPSLAPEPLFPLSPYREQDRRMESAGGRNGSSRQRTGKTARPSRAPNFLPMWFWKISTWTGQSKTSGFSARRKTQTVEARFVLVNFGRNVLAKFTGQIVSSRRRTDEGSVFKINMLLRKLPKLKAKQYPATEAFCGTFHTDEGYEQMNLSYEQAAKGNLPDKPPSEVYCHTLTDDSILAPELRAKGFHTMTLFGIDTPYSVVRKTTTSTMRAEAEKKFLASMNQWLEEPLEDCLAVARDGSLCIESKSRSISRNR